MHLVRSFKSNGKTFGRHHVEAIYRLIGGIRLYLTELLQQYQKTHGAGGSFWYKIKRLSTGFRLSGALV